MSDSKKPLNTIDFTNKIISFIQANDYESLHQLENTLLETATLNFNRDVAEVCVLIYGLRKIISKKHISKTDFWINYRLTIIDNLKSAVKLYKEEDPSKYNNIIKSTMVIVKEVDKKHGRFVNFAIDDGRIKLASTAYAFGLSASQASDLFSITKKQFMSYIGVTKMPDEDKPFKSIKERVNMLDENSINRGRIK